MKEPLGRAGLAALSGLLCATCALAGTTGRLRGTVTDTAREPLAGVTVIISSPSQIGGPRTTQTDANGEYTFVELTPGTFIAVFTLDGFATGEASEVAVRLDGTTELNAELGEARIEDAIEVVGEAPQVDPARVSISQTFTQEHLERAVVGMDSRDCYCVVGQAPGVSGQRFLGSTGGENAYLFDGVESNDAAMGTAGVTVPYDAIQALNLRTAGAEAELGGASGGFVNLVTKSGGNRFSGTADARYYDQSFIEKGTHYDPEARPVENERVSATLGGPILIDRLWFFAAYQYDDRSETPEGAPVSRGRRADHYFAKLSWQIDPAWLASVRYTMAAGDWENWNSGPTVGADATYAADQRVELYQADASGTLGPNLLLNLRGSHQARRTDVYPQSGDYDLSGHYDANGVLPSSVNYSRAEDFSWDRDQVYGDLSWFLATAGGTHQLKLGGEWERSSMIDEIWAIGGYEYVDDGTLPFLLYYEPNPGASPSKGQQLSGFVQDEWRIRERLTLKGGLRYDAVRFDNDVGTTVIDYGKLQPRLGLAWDLSSKATSVARASWGRYMHPGILVVPWLARQQQLPTFIYLSCSYFGFSRDDCQANFGGELTAGGLTVPTWIDDPQRTDADGFLLVPDNVLLSQPSQIAPDLAPTYADTLTIGFEQQLGRRTSLDVSYVDKKTYDIFEDTCNGNVPTPTAGGACDYFVVANLAELRRDYRGLIVKLESRAFDWLEILASYTYSKSRGSIEYTQSAGTDFDFYPQHYVNRYGWLSDDARHQVKLSGYAILPAGFGLGVAGFWSSPFPYSKTRRALPWGVEYLEPRGSLRANSTYQLDLEVRKEFQIGQVRPVILLSILNALGTEYAYQVCENAAGCAGDVPFGGAVSHAIPRYYELGVRLTF